MPAQGWNKLVSDAKSAPPDVTSNVSHGQLVSGCIAAGPKPPRARAATPPPPVMNGQQLAAFYGGAMAAQPLVGVPPTVAMNGQQLVGVATPQRSAQRQARRWKWPTWSKLSKWCCGAPPVMGVAAVVAASGMGPDVVQVAANLSQSVNKVADSMTDGFGVGVNVTRSISDLGISIARGSVSLMEEAWAGVDLLNASVTASGARWFFDPQLGARGFWDSDISKVLVRAPANQTNILKLATASVSPLLPKLRDAKVSHDVRGTYSEFQYQVQLFPNGLTGVQYFHGAVNYTPAWANPVWEVVGQDISRALPRIQDLLQDALAKAAPWEFRRQNLHDDPMSTLDRVRPAAWWQLRGAMLLPE